MLQGTKWKVKVEAELSKEFMIDRDLNQRDVLSADLFNLILEKVIKETEIKAVDF
jgi:hypothetical protein